MRVSQECGEPGKREEGQASVTEMMGATSMVCYLEESEQRLRSTAMVFVFLTLLLDFGSYLIFASRNFLSCFLGPMI